MPKQILVAEDSATIQRAIEITFAKEDVVLTQVRSGDDAIAKAQALRPDIVLADAGMAKSGYDVCAALRADPNLAGTAVLLLTGNFSPYDDVRGQKCGADGYVVKPFETQALIDKVNEAIAKRAKGTPMGVTLLGVPPANPTPVVPAPTPPAPAPAPAPAPVAAKPMAPPIAAAPSNAPTAAAKPEPQATPTAKTVVGASLADLLGKGGPARITSGSMPAVNPADFADPPAKAPEPPKPVAAPVAAPVAPPPVAVKAAEPPKVVASQTTPAAATVMMEAPKVQLTPPAAPAPVAKAPEPPKPVAAPIAVKAVEPEIKKVVMPKDVPMMPRPSLIPNTPQPQAAVAVAPAPPQPRMPPAPKATLMGIPTIGMPGLGLGASPAPANAPVVAAPAPAPTPVPAPAPQPKLVPQTIPDAPTPRPETPQTVAAAVSASAVDKVEAKIAEKGPEYAVLAKLTREAIEQIVWEIVPELAEVIIKENLAKKS